MSCSLFLRGERLSKLDIEFVWSPVKGPQKSWDLLDFKRWCNYVVITLQALWIKNWLETQSFPWLPKAVFFNIELNISCEMVPLMSL